MEGKMNPQQEKEERFSGFLSMSGKVFFIILAVFALVALPYRFDHQKGSYVSSVVFAEEGGGDSGDHDGAGDSDGDHDADHDSDGSGQDIGEDHDDGDSHDVGEDQDDGEDHDDVDENEASHEADHDGDTNAGEHDDLNQSQKGTNSIGGIQGLTPVSPQEEASLVGNWGDSSNK